MESFGLSTLPPEIIAQIFQFLSLKDLLTLASLQNDVLDTMLGHRIVYFYRHVYRFLPCGLWCQAREQKYYDIKLAPDLFGMYIEFYSSNNRKRMCFNKRNGMRLVRKRCRPVHRTEDLPGGFPIGSAFICVIHEIVHVFNFRHNSRSMHVLLFENHKLMRKKWMKPIGKSWIQFFCWNNTHRLSKMLRYERIKETIGRRNVTCIMCY